MIYRYITGNTLENMEATIEDNYKTTEEIKGEKIQINILDTAGEEDYQNLFDSWLRQTDGVLLVFALDDKDSFECLNEKHQRIKKNEELEEVKYPIVLVGNKCDLVDSRMVSKEEAEKFANKIGAKYYEVSALNDMNNNIKMPFISCAMSILKDQGPTNNKCKKCITF